MSSLVGGSRVLGRLVLLAAVAPLLLTSAAAAPVRAYGPLPCTIDPIADQTVAEGQVVEVEVHANNPNSYPYDHLSLSIGPPAFATLQQKDAATWTLRIAPGFGDAGAYPGVGVTTSSTNDLHTTATFTITVTNVNREPVLDLIAPQTVAEGATTDVQLSATDPDGDPITISKDTLPGFATLTDHHDGTATIHLAPGYADAGTYSDQTVDVYDGTAYGSQVAFDITVTNTDTAAPVVTVPDDTTVEATGPAGAVVSYSASATDDIDGAITPSCTPPSGSTFVVGQTTVTCSATDSDGHTGSASFVVTVVDTTVPDVTQPGGAPLPDITVAATSASGARVTFSVGASDIVDPSVSPTCRPTSGHLFAVGTTRVRCTARDAAGNTGSASFRVTVTGSSGPVPSAPETSTTASSPEAPRPGSPLGLVVAALGSLLAVTALGRRQRTRR